MVLTCSNYYTGGGKMVIFFLILPCPCSGVYQGAYCASSIYTFAVPDLESAISQRSPYYLQWRMVFQNQDPGTSYTYWYSQAPLSVHRAKTIWPYIYIYAYTFVYIYTHTPYMYSTHVYKYLHMLYVSINVHTDTDYISIYKYIHLHSIYMI